MCTGELGALREGKSTGYIRPFGWMGRYIGEGEVWAALVGCSIFLGDGEDAKASPPLCPCSCGNCKRSQPCSPVDGFCLACQPGWNGTLCKERCAPGFHGEGCLQPCPRCRHGDACDAETGSCLHCEPGWMGPRYPPCHCLPGCRMRP